MPLFLYKGSGRNFLDGDIVAGRHSRVSLLAQAMQGKLVMRTYSLLLAIVAAWSLSSAGQAVADRVDLAERHRQSFRPRAASSGAARGICIGTETECGGVEARRHREGGRELRPARHLRPELGRAHPKSAKAEPGPVRQGVAGPRSSPRPSSRSTATPTRAAPRTTILGPVGAARPSRHFSTTCPRSAVDTARLDRDGNFGKSQPPHRRSVRRRAPPRRDAPRRAVSGAVGLDRALLRGGPPGGTPRR